MDILEDNFWFSLFRELVGYYPSKSIFHTAPLAPYAVCPASSSDFRSGSVDESLKNEKGMNFVSWTLEYPRKSCCGKCASQRKPQLLLEGLPR